jgi:outer membrane lipoprotein-sorting protein
MRLRTTGALCSFSALLAGVVAAAPAPKSMKFNLNTVTDAQGMHMNVQAKVWVKGRKARIETNQPMSGPMLVLVDGSTVRKLFPQRKQGTISTVPEGKNGPKSPWEFLIASVDQLTHGAKKLGKESLDGYRCDVYQIRQQRPQGSMTLKSWITSSTQPRLPLKVETVIQVKRPNMTMEQKQTTRITGVQMGVPIADSLFAVPAGYKIVQGGPPGGPGGPGMGGPAPRP